MCSAFGSFRVAGATAQTTQNILTKKHNVYSKHVHDPNTRSTSEQIALVLQWWTRSNLFVRGERILQMLLAPNGLSAIATTSHCDGTGHGRLKATAKPLYRLFTCASQPVETITTQRREENSQIYSAHQGFQGADPEYDRGRLQKGKPLYKTTQKQKMTIFQKLKKKGKSRRNCTGSHQL